MSHSEVELARALAVGQQAWPTLVLAPPAFAAFLCRNEKPLAEFDDDVLQDLFLACACAHNVPGALRLFREKFFPMVTVTVRRFDDSSAFAEEVFQRLSEALFVGGPDGRPKILTYAGQGALAGFLGTAAKRIGLRMVTTAARFQGEAELVNQLSLQYEQETEMLKRQHRETFNRALAIALRELPRRDRLVLRMNLIERVSTTRIAAMYNVSQPTVSRWIQRSARAIFATVKDLVCDELEIDTRELESLLLLVRSQIEITISHASHSGGTSR